MSARIIPLKRRSTPPLMNIRIDAIERLLTTGSTPCSLDTMQIQLIIEDLRSRQDTLLSAIESLREPILRANPKFDRVAAELEAVSSQVLAETGLLIRRGTALLQRHERAEA